MWTASLVMVPLWLASGSTGTAYQAGLSAELRSRSGLGASAQLELVPGLALEHTHETLTLGVRYAPLLRLTVEPGAALQSPNVLHATALQAAWTPDARSQLAASQALSYGVNEFDPLSPAADPAASGAPPLETRPTGPVRQYFASDSALTLRRALSLRTALELAGRYQVSGSLDPDERAQLPLQHGPTAQARLTHALSLRDALLTQVSATQATFTSPEAPSESALTLLASQGWRRRLTRTVDGQLSLGAAALRTTAPTSEAPGRVRALPVADAELAYTPPVRAVPLTLSAAARYAPFIDRVSGEAYGRGEASLALGFAPTPTLQLSTRASAARSLSQRSGAAPLASLEAGATWRRSPALALSAGLRSAWDSQAQADGTQARRFEAAGFLNLTLLAREVL